MSGADGAALIHSGVGSWVPADLANVSCAGDSSSPVLALPCRAPRSYVSTGDLELPQWGTALPATYSWDANNGAGSSSTTITAAPAA